MIPTQPTARVLDLILMQIQEHVAGCWKCSIVNGMVSACSDVGFYIRGLKHNTTDALNAFRAGVAIRTLRRQPGDDPNEITDRYVSFGRSDNDFDLP